MVQKTILLFLIFLISSLMTIAFGFLNYRYKQRTIDYYVMFIIGIGWTILGLIFKIAVLVIVGALFSIIGYFKKNLWEKDVVKTRRANVDELGLLKHQTDMFEMVFTLLVFLGILVLLGVIIYMYLMRMAT